MKIPDSYLRCMNRPKALQAPPAVPQQPVILAAHKPAESVLTPKTGMDSGSGWLDRNNGTVEGFCVMKFTVWGNPVGKPRMTQRDKWAKRPAVLRYRAWADLARASAPSDLPKSPTVLCWKAYLAMPESWSKKKKAQMCGQWHRQKFDRDNIDKAVLDSLFEQDCGIAYGVLEKRWDDGNGPRIEITVG